MTTKRVSEKKLGISPGAAKAISTRKASAPQRTPRSAAQVEIAVTGVATGVNAPQEPTTAQAIAALAYSYWEARGFTGGSPEEDWIRAERELRESLAVVRFSNATA